METNEDNKKDLNIDDNQQKNRRLERNTREGVIGGVLAGVADYTQINANVLRVIFVFLLLFGGVFVIMLGLYLLAWLIMPRKQDREALPFVAGDGQLQQSFSSTDSPLLNVFKYGCVGTAGIFAFFVLVIALLLVIPSIYLSDFFNIITDPMISTYDSITFDIGYHPDVPLLVLGALIVFVMPVCYFVLRRRNPEEEQRTMFWILLIVWVAGIFMIISSLTNNSEDFEKLDIDYSFFNVNFERNKFS